MKRFIIIALAIATMCAINARTRTTHNRLSTDAVAMERVAPSTGDTTTTVDQNAVTLRGYSKRASDHKESFFVTNNLECRISSITLLMRYTTLDGSMLHERTITIPVSLKSNESRLVSIATFDVQHMFYYHAGPKPRKSATPFKVAVRLLGYDIPVGY